MTMPIQFDTAQYIQRLLEADIPYAQAVAHAEALKLALSQPVANDADVAISRAEIRAMFAEFETRMDFKIDAKLDAKLRPLWIMTMINTMAIVAIAVKLFL